jgi:hypothetical protein
VLKVLSTVKQVQPGDLIGHKLYTEDRFHVDVVFNVSVKQVKDQFPQAFIKILCTQDLKITTKACMLHYLRYHQGIWLTDSHHAYFNII